MSFHSSIQPSKAMKITHLIAIACIFICTCAAWIVLGQTLTSRTQSAGADLDAEVTRNWGPPLKQSHPVFYYIAPNATRAKRFIQPESSRVDVALSYQPKRKGLLNYRAYATDFTATYVVKNPAPIAQVIYGTFKLPAGNARYDAFSLSVGGKVTDKVPTSGSVTESMLLQPGESLTIAVTYRANGMDTWRYEFDAQERVTHFQLEMTTDFADINFPGDTVSAQEPRGREGDGWRLKWEFEDVIGARAIGMDMPKLLNAGPVASRIAFFAPVSLLFYFAVLVIVAMTRGVPLHPMHWFFLAAGCFAFQLLFAYLVDLVPALPSFGIAALVSLLLVAVYLWRVAGGTFAKVAAGAQFAYMVLFSYSFFFDGLTGITITVGAIVTLFLLMMHTARTDWARVFAGVKSGIDAGSAGVTLGAASVE